MARIVELWDEVIRQKGMDVNQAVSFVTANEIKAISHKEPRIMAKMDTIEDMPEVFRKNGLFLLPVSRTKYALVKGNGFHRLEDISKPTVHVTHYHFPSWTEGVKSEGVFLDYALSSGVLGRFTSTANIHLTFRGRRTTPSFTFSVQTTALEVHGAQMELDGGFSDPDGDQMIGVEAKIGVPSSFNIRQLYYPYRTFQARKPVRSVFFVYEPRSSSYLFWEYEFEPSTQFDGIKLANQGNFQVKVEDAVSLKTYRNVPATINEIPQADSVDKIIEFPFRVLEGYDTSEKVKDAFGFTQRQSSYYRQASEILGLVELQRNRYRLTSEGEYYVKLPTEKRVSYMCERLLSFKLMSEIWAKLSVNREAVITRDNITSLIKERSGLAGTTPSRRGQTIIAWFRWIQSHLGIVEVDKAGTVTTPKQPRL